MRRRNTLIGLGTIVFGASGFVVSGAFELGSEGSTGSDWVRVSGVDNPVQSGEDGSGDDADDQESEDESADGIGGGSSDDDEDESADGGGDDEEEDDEEEDDEEEDDEEEDDEEEDDEEEDDEEDEDEDDGPPGTGPPNDDQPQSGSTRVQVVTDPSNPGNLVSTLEWEGRMSTSSTLLGDDDGFLEGFSVDNVNQNALSRVGVVDSSGYPIDRIAFLIGAIGESTGPGTSGYPSVEVRARLFDTDGTHLESTDQIRFPYRVVSPNGATTVRGLDLLDSAVVLPAGHLVEVVIEIDTRQGTAALERIGRLHFDAGSPGGTPS